MDVGVYGSLLTGQLNQQLAQHDDLRPAYGIVADAEQALTIARQCGRGRRKTVGRRGVRRKVGMITAINGGAGSTKSAATSPDKPPQTSSEPGAALAVRNRR